MSGRSLGRSRLRPGPIFTDIPELSGGVYSTTQYLVYKCTNPDANHEYTERAIRRLMKNIKSKFLSIFVNTDTNRIGFDSGCGFKFPYIDSSGKLKDDLVRSKMCLLCIMNHLDSKRDELKNCYFNEEEEK